MNESTLGAVLEAVKTAIITELRGYEIYKVAAERATDASARQMFQSLAEDELAHKDFLEKNYASLRASGQWSMPATPENLSPLDHTEIISPDFLRRVKGGAFEMGVISAGVALEQSAIAYYAEQAKLCEDPVAKETFRFLAQWEKGHLEALIDCERQMRDQYFAERGFTPF